MHPLLASILFHAIGAASASVCYVPQRKLKGWSWQTYWLTQASFCWLLLPLIGAFMTVPTFWSVVQEAPRDAILRTFLLGAAYGIGGTAFGLAIRYVGFSITYATAIGVSTLVGTAYAIVKGDTSLTNYAANIQAFWNKTGSGWVLLGIGIGIVGIAFCGLAGRWKERDLNPAAVTPGRSNAVIGLTLCLLAGVLSGVYGMALTEGAPIAKLAESAALGHTILGVDATSFRNNAIYPFSNTGAFLTTAIYCVYLHYRRKTFGEIVSLPKGVNPGHLPVNWAMAILTGCLWYGQFFFYGFGHFFIMKVEGFEQACWAIHMILSILLGTLVGVVLKEWNGCRRSTKLTLAWAVTLLIAGKLLLDYGNYIGQTK